VKLPTAPLAAGIIACVFMLCAGMAAGSGHGYRESGAAEGSGRTAAVVSGRPALLIASRIFQERSVPESQQGKAEAKKTAATGDAAKGQAVFEGTCSFCHIPDSDETLIGPGLKGLFHWPPHQLSDGTERPEETEESVRHQIVEGGGAMQPAGADLSEEDLANLIAYLKTL
jgi:cytochrome c2